MRSKMKPLALAICAATTTPAFAITFQYGELEGQFDSSLSIGASWSAQRDHQRAEVRYRTVFQRLHASSLA